MSEVKDKGKGKEKVIEKIEDLYPEDKSIHVPFTEDFAELTNLVEKALSFNAVVLVGSGYQHDSGHCHALVYDILRNDIGEIYKNRKDVFIVEFYLDTDENRKLYRVTKKYVTLCLYVPGKSKSVHDPVHRQVFTKNQMHLFRYVIHDFVRSNTDHLYPYIYKDLENAQAVAEKPFAMFERAIYDTLTLLRIGSKQVVALHSEVLADLARSVTHDKGHEVDFYELDQLVENRKLKKKDRWNVVPFAELVVFIDDVNREDRELAEKAISEGRVAYDHLKYLFKIDDEIITRGKKSIWGGRITKITNPERRRRYGGGWFSVETEGVFTEGNKIQLGRHSFSIHPFPQLKNIADLKFQHITKAEKESMTERGKRFRQIALGSHYQYLRGNMYHSGWWKKQEIKVDGRVMVDLLSFYKMEQVRRNRGYNQIRELTEISDDILWITPPRVVGFSFDLKRWGEFPVESLADVIFDETAFEKLVLPLPKKRMITAFVTKQGGTFTDIIKGKGGGSIFLLHGPPGTGKTLTAEAISETLHRPLYNISVGELGVTPQDLEEKLKKILELAAVWNAVVLLDEADIFLEARSREDIKRNAMVGVFLRVLEYHNGVLFMTSNRVKCFDEAFHSRVSVSLQYSRFDNDSRAQIWHNLLSSANVPHYYQGTAYLNPSATSRINANIFATHELNGRQIRTTIRLAQTLAVSEGLTLSGITEEHVLMCIELAMQFVQHTADMSNPAADEFSNDHDMEEQ